MDKYWCRYCGEEKNIEDRDAQVGKTLAEIASLEALGHAEGVTPYLICKSCAEEVVEVGKQSGY